MYRHYKYSPQRCGSPGSLAVLVCSFHLRCEDLICCQAFALESFVVRQPAPKTIGVLSYTPRTGERPHSLLSVPAGLAGSCEPAHSFERIFKMLSCCVM
jgi:hypothetical protein